MAEFDDREHYIPLRKSDMLQLLLRDPKMAGQTEDRAALERLHTLTGAIFHFEYFDQLEKLKDLYGPFDPDRETVDLFAPTPEKRSAMLVEFFEGVGQLLAKANFTRLSEDDVRKAMAGSSDWGINMDVDFSVFEQYEIWVRGDTKGTRTKRHWLFFWKTVDKEIEIYKRFIIVCKLKKDHPRLKGKSIDTETLFLKIFKDIPKQDLEMLMPGAKIQMPFFQKATMSGSLLGGLGYILYSVGSVIWNGIGFIVAAGLAGLSVLLTPMAALLGFSFKQYTAYNTARQKYTLMLTESLYYQNLDNNLGVLTRILDEAEEQECREVVLGYFFLWKYAGPEGWTEEALDDTIEKYVEEKSGLKVDFEIGDSLEKLVNLKMVRKVGDRYIAEPIEKALEALDERWDNYFQYNQA